jgi:hypothetical protein
LASLSVVAWAISAGAALLVLGLALASAREFPWAEGWVLETELVAESEAAEQSRLAAVELLVRAPVSRQALDWATVRRLA